jgi:hypothetical protein
MVNTLSYIFRIYRAALHLAYTYLKCSSYAMRALANDTASMRPHKVCEDIESMMDPLLTSIKILIYYPVYTMYRVHKFRNLTLIKATRKWERLQLHTSNPYRLYDAVVAREPYGF